MSENELIEKLIAGDEKAFRSFIEAHQQKVFRTCIGFLHDKEDAEDVTQEVFIEVFRSVKNYKGNAALSTWLYRIAVNKSLNFLQKRKGGFLVSLKEVLGISETVYNPQKELLIKERNSFLANAIDQLPEKQRIAFTLAKYDDLSYQEIAEVMQTSVSSVESLIVRAKSNLQKMLKSYFPEKK